MHEHRRGFRNSDPPQNTEEDSLLEKNYQMILKLRYSRFNREDFQYILTGFSVTRFAVHFAGLANQYIAGGCLEEFDPFFDPPKS